MNVYPSQQPQNRTKLSGIYMGDAMSGKSHCAATWPNPLVLCFDPDTSTVRSMPGVWVVELATWSELETAVMPYVRNRALGKFVAERMGSPTEPPIDTIVVDTISIGATRLVQELQGTKDRLTQADYGLLLNKLTATTMQLIETTKESALNKDLPTYNVILTTHLRTVTNDQGAIEGIRPAIPGQFQDMLPRLGGFAFLCEHGVATSFVNGKSTEIESFHVRTVPPNNRYICGDRIGGKNGLKRLPTKVGGTYQELCEAWGRQP